MQRAFPLALALLAALPAALAAQSQTPPAERAHAAHVLNRLAFGPRPGDVQRVLQLGTDRWIEQQLNADPTDDLPAVPSGWCELWMGPLDRIGAVKHTVEFRNPEGTMMRGRITLSSGGLQLRRPEVTGPASAIYELDRRIVACRLMRAERSEQQLLEVMTDFWSNHFSVFSQAVPSRGALVLYDRAAIRPYALGRFRDLLGAVAHSPAMLAYLNNDVSGPLDTVPSLAEHRRGRAPGTIARTGLNENYARELMELHTLGVDGGYTQADVIAVARAFSGWSHTGRIYGCIEPASQVVVNTCRHRQVEAPVFQFDSTKHDAGSKIVFGRELSAGRGLEDGEDVLDMLARHPSTAQFIARKLAVRFVSDAPPQALVASAAATFVATDGDIRAVLRTIITSDDFRAAQGVKIKTPVEFVLSVRRVLGAPFDTEGYLVDALLDMEQPPYGRRTPDGWPETASSWLNTGAVIARVNYAHAVAHGEIPSITLDMWPAWQSLAHEPYAKQVDGALAQLLPGAASPQLRAALLAARPEQPLDDDAARERALRRIVALVLGSPDFQRR